MLKLRKIGFVVTLASVFALTACHPKVEPATDLDKELNCVQLRSEIQKVRDVKTKIDKSRGFSARNVGLGLIFWPGIVINEVTGDSAETDANARLTTLQNIYATKQCSKSALAEEAKTEKTAKG